MKSLKIWKEIISAILEVSSHYKSRLAVYGWSVLATGLMCVFFFSYTSLYWIIEVSAALTLHVIHFQTIVVYLVIIAIVKMCLLVFSLAL